MIVSLRSTLLVMAALSASSVAPAQVRPDSEPLIVDGTKSASALLIPAVMTPELPRAKDPLAPVIVPVVPQVDDQAEEAEDDKPVGRDLPSLVAEMRDSTPGSSELECLAGAIYFEAKSESLKGQLAVGHVIANRAKSGRFPSSYCGVVYQRSQFSFVRGRSMPPIARSGTQWKNAVAVAKIVDQGLLEAPMPKALFFHARRVSPGWKLTRLGTLGNHVFYR